MLVLGIDPGSYNVGFGLVQKQGKSLTIVDHGVFQISRKLAFHYRLQSIFDAVTDLVKKTGPDIMAVEESFVSQNAKTALRLGHARGVILLSGVQQSVPIVEYAPREIKQAVVGRGGATKDQVSWMICQQFHIEQRTLSEDASDALATALCCCYREAGL